MAIWTKTISAPSDLSVPAISENIGFQAQSIVVDNFTPYWLYIPSSLGYIPPWTTDVVRGLIHATDFVKVEWRSPLSDTQVLQSTAKFVSFLFTDAIIPASSGTIAYGIPQLVNNIITSYPYTASNMVITDLGVLGPILAIEPSSGGYSLQSLTFNSPTVAQTYSIYRANGLSSRGATKVPTNVYDPIVPIFNGLVRYQSNTMPSSTVIVGPRNFSSNTGTVNLTVPTTSISGDILIAFIHATNNAAGFMTPTGWTLQLSQIGAASTGNLAIFTRIADTNDPGKIYAFNITGVAGIEGFICAVREANAIYSNSSINVISSATTVVSWNSTSATPPGIGLAVSFGNYLSATFTPSSGATKLVDETALFRIGLEQYSYTASPTQPGNAAWSASAAQINGLILISTTNPNMINLLAPYSGDPITTTASIPTGVETVVDLSTLGIIARNGATSGLVVVPNTSPVAMTLSVKLQSV